MGVWDVLGIGPTDDESAIKKAYAKKLKIYHPEDDPAGYQKLREAYDAALKLAKYLKKVKPETKNESAAIDDHSENGSQEQAEGADQGQRTISSPGENPKPGETGVSDDSPNRGDNDSGKNTQNVPNVRLMPEHMDSNSPRGTVPRVRIGSAYDITGIEDQNAEFLRNIQSLYGDFASRIEPGNWDRLMNCDAVWNIGNRARLNEIILSFLETHRYLPQEIWKLLNVHFKWSETESAGQSGNHGDLVRYIIKQLRLPGGLSFAHLREAGDIDYDKYLEYREAAFFAFMENKLNVAGFNIGRAKGMFDGDPELFRLEGQLYFRTEEDVEALNALNRLLERIPDDTDGLVLRARLFRKRGDLEQAIRDYSRAAGLMPGNAKVLQALAQCCMDAGQPETARQNLLHFAALGPRNEEILTMLSKANILTKEKWKRELKNDPGNAELKKKIRGIDSELKFRTSQRLKKIKGRVPGRRYLPALFVLLAFPALMVFVVVLANSHKDKPEQRIETPTPRTAAAITDLSDPGQPPADSEVTVKAQDIACLGLACEFENAFGENMNPVFTPAEYDADKPQDALMKEWVCIGRIGDSEVIFVVPAFTLVSTLSLSVPGFGENRQTQEGTLYEIQGSFYSFSSVKTVVPVLDEMRKDGFSDKAIDKLAKDRFFLAGEKYVIPEISYKPSTGGKTPLTSLAWPVIIILLAALRAGTKRGR